MWPRRGRLSDIFDARHSGQSIFPHAFGICIHGLIPDGMVVWICRFYPHIFIADAISIYGPTTSYRYRDTFAPTSIVSDFVSQLRSSMLLHAFTPCEQSERGATYVTLRCSSMSVCVLHRFPPVTRCYLCDARFTGFIVGALSQLREARRYRKPRVTARKPGVQDDIRLRASERRCDLRHPALPLHFF